MVRAPLPLPAACRLNRAVATTLSSTANDVYSLLISIIVSALSNEEPREPGTGANMVRQSPTHRDPLGVFALVRGSPLDSGRLSRTSRTCMACRRSGVRISLAPRNFSHAYSMKKYQTIGSGSRPDLRKRSASHCGSHAEGRGLAVMREPLQAHSAANSHATLVLSLTAAPRRPMSCRRRRRSPGR
jgi:hypothetical protein